MKVIGIAGKAESGKDTFGAILKEELESQGKKVMHIGYGDFVKFIAKQYYNWNGEKDEHGRWLLQHIGTEEGRMKVNENIWVDMVINTIQVADKDYDVAIITDCRFLNEFDRWREFGFDMLKIKMLRLTHQNKLTEEQRQHPSETSLDNYNDCILVQNEGTLEDLRDIAKQIIKVNL